MDKLTPLEKELLLTLSYFEQMNLEAIYIDLRQDFLLENHELTMEDLQSSLNVLVKRKLILQIDNKIELKWQRKYKSKRSFLQRIMSFIK